MRKNILRICLSGLCFFFGSVAVAQQKISFLEQWEAGQVKADSIAHVFVAKYSEVKHLKVKYKSFYDDIVHKHAKKYKIDFTRMGLAGGYLSALVAMRTPECRCYVGYNGVYDLKGKSFPGFMKHHVEETFPIDQIRTNPPITLLLHGKADTTVPCQESLSFAEAIREKEGIAGVILYDGQKHAFFNKEPYL